MECEKSLLKCCKSKFDFSGYYSNSKLTNI